MGCDESPPSGDSTYRTRSWRQRRKRGLVQLRHRLDDLREAASEVVSVARVKPNAFGVAAGHDAEAVVFNLVQPSRPRWGLFGA